MWMHLTVSVWSTAVLLTSADFLDITEEQRRLVGHTWREPRPQHGEVGVLANGLRLRGSCMDLSSPRRYLRDIALTL